MESDAQGQDKRPSLHIAPDAGPDDTLALINTLNYNHDHEFRNLKELCYAAGQMYNAGERPRDSPTIANMLALINLNPVRLTEIGGRIANARAEYQADLIHYMLYTGWSAQHPNRNAQLWTYQHTCDLLWQMGKTEVKGGELKDSLTGAIDKEPAFSGMFSSSESPFSTKTIRGVTIWLEKLHPPAITRPNDKSNKLIFERRTICSRELLLLSIGWVYRDVTGEPDEQDRLNTPDLLLTRERREALCKVCLLEPASLERMLDSVIATYPSYIHEGTSGGAFGRAMRLYRRPTIKDRELLF